MVNFWCLLWNSSRGGGRQPPPVCWAKKASRAIFAPQSGNIGLLLKKMGQILSILWEIVLISWEILWYLENLYDVSKNLGMSEKFLDP
jgi:hypothetical protein